MTAAEPTKQHHLRAARATKNDEFYTQWPDIEQEMNAYVEFHTDVFRDKVVLLPCDDPEWSNFAKFFALHFHDFGLKRLIATSCAPDSKPDPVSYQPTLFETQNPQFDERKTRSNGKLFVLDRDLNGDGIIDLDDLQWKYLDGTGDFRSAEVTALRNEADIIVTNPPFSLFREFVKWLHDGHVQYSIIGNQNAITYKEIFPLIQNNKLWKGATGNSKDMVFGVPKGAKISSSDIASARRLGYQPNEHYDYTRLGNSCWFTNIEHGRRHQPLELMTKADNLKFNQTLKNRGGYRYYDNYSALDVPLTIAIPSDHLGDMGVPISFLDRYNPNQFEILGIAKAPLGRPSKIYPKQTQVGKTGERSQVSKLNDGPAIKIQSPLDGDTYYEVDGQYFIQLFARILIRNRAQK